MGFPRLAVCYWIPTLNVHTTLHNDPFVSNLLRKLFFKDNLFHCEFVKEILKPRLVEG